MAKTDYDTLAWIVGGLFVEPVALIAAVASGGAGHGSYLWANVTAVVQREDAYV